MGVVGVRSAAVQPGEEGMVSTTAVALEVGKRITQITDSEVLPILSLVRLIATARFGPAATAREGNLGERVRDHRLFRLRELATVLLTIRHQLIVATIDAQFVEEIRDLVLDRRIGLLLLLLDDLGVGLLRALSGIHGGGLTLATGIGILGFLLCLCDLVWDYADGWRKVKDDEHRKHKQGK